MIYNIFAPFNKTQYRMTLKSALEYLQENPGKKLLLLPEYSEISTELVFEKCRRDALQLIADKHVEMLRAATGGATGADRDTWLVKERAAWAVIDGATTSAVLRPVGDETLLQLAQKVISKASAYEAIVGSADEIKRTAEKAVEAVGLETLDDLALLDAALDNAKAAADAAMAALTASPINT